MSSNLVSSNTPFKRLQLLIVHRTTLIRDVDASQKNGRTRKSVFEGSSTEQPRFMSGDA